MSRIFITGSADGLGQMAGRILVSEGHDVVLHARNEKRADEAFRAVPGALAVVSGDLSSITETRSVAEQVNKLPGFDAVIHNAAIGYREQRRVETTDGLPHVFAVNTLAPYLLTCLIRRPHRLIYLSSGLHRSGDPSLRYLTCSNRAWSGINAYADTKLHNVMLAFAVARKWPGVFSNAVEPGWVATKMGGAGAPDSLEKGPVTQAWLASSQEPAALVTGSYFYHQKLRDFLPSAADPALQDKLLAECERLSGVHFPGG